MASLQPNPPHVSMQHTEFKTWFFNKTVMSQTLNVVRLGGGGWNNTRNQKLLLTFSEGIELFWSYILRTCWNANHKSCAACQEKILCSDVKNRLPTLQEREHRHTCLQYVSCLLLFFIIPRSFPCFQRFSHTFVLSTYLLPCICYYSFVLCNLFFSLRLVLSNSLISFVCVFIS